MAGEGLVTKVKIIAYEDPLFSARKKEGEAEVELQVNPQEIALSFGVEDGEDEGGGSGNNSSMTSTETAAGESFKPKVFKGYSCPDLTIDTIIDATGVLPGEKKLLFAKGSTTEPSVQEYVKKIKSVCYDYVKECHGPPYLAIAWGNVFLTQSNDSALAETSIFKCILSNMDVKYTLFSASGNPIRAEISLKFRGFQDAESRATGHSPDLTHLIEIKYGDNLPALCKRIYGSPEFFLQIARVNNLPSIYAIEPGMKLVFPPLDKASR